VIIKVPKFPQVFQWFMYDLGNNQLITSIFIPGDITDTKDIVYAETPIPGLSHQPIQSGGMGNRKISFELPLIKRNGIIGNVHLLKQFDRLRNPTSNFASAFMQSSQFTSNPKVLYNWGIGSVPLIWYVKKCDPTHKQHWVNAFGQPQYSELQFELWLDENNPLNRAEEIWRQLASIYGQVESTLDNVKYMQKRRSY
jgi:hypothetical protein